MKQYQYDLPTGQIVLSPSNLYYAFNEKTELDFTKIKKHDLARLSVFANNRFANICQELSDSKSWRTPNAAINEPDHPELSREKNFCVIHNGSLYILNGTRYVPLDNMIESADADMLALILQKVAFQAAICQAALAGQDTQNSQSTL